MGVNFYKKHLYILLEDAPYREILNGTKMTNFNYDVVKVNHLSRGWKVVFEDFMDSIAMLKKYENRYTLLLMDFDYKFISRLEKFHQSVPEELKNRVFILGIDNKESDALKSFFRTPNFEKIGKNLVENCSDGDLSNWKNIHLNCNLPEIERMRDAGIFDWLFI